MNSPDEDRPKVPLAMPPPEGPVTNLGNRLNELQPAAAEKEVRDLAAGLRVFEELSFKVTEHAGRFLVVVNGGGIMVCLAVVTTLVSSGKPVIQVLPGALLFILGLALCGWGILRAGRRLEGEVRRTFRDVGHVARSEMTTEHAVQAALHRRYALGGKPGVAVFSLSFSSFIGGAMALLIGLAWPELVPLTVRLWHFLSSLI